MAPQPGNPMEVGGVLNPASARAPDGQLYLFPRLVGHGNYSRIGIARVRFNATGDPEGVERIGIALEPKEDFEGGQDGSGGCEDPRITFVEPLHRYVMTYTALSPRGPRIALAISEDLLQWHRLGLATFRPYQGIEFEDIDNKDASVFPIAIPDPSGQMSMALLHRPLFSGTRPEDMVKKGLQRHVDLDHESIWISYFSTAMNASAPPEHRCDFGSHHRLATPIAAWERLKIGGGTPPIMTRHGWLTIYHGVSVLTYTPRELCYSAGVLILSKDAPHIIRYRSAEPVLTPELRLERQGGVANVVFPTAIDRRDDLETPDRFDVYYGMADARIGVAKLLVPKVLPGEARADARQATV